MESALARQPRDGSAALRARRARRVALGIAAAAVLTGLLWLAPLQNFHLLPAAADADHGTARSSAPRMTTQADKISGAQLTGKALSSPKGQSIETADKANPNSNIAAPVEPTSAPPVLLVGRISGGKEAVSLNVEPVPPPILIPIGSTPPPAARGIAAATSSPRPAASPLAGLPQTRPPLPLETDLIAAGTPDVRSAAQSNAAPPAPAGYPTVSEHRG